MTNSVVQSSSKEAISYHSDKKIPVCQGTRNFISKFTNLLIPVHNITHYIPKVNFNIILRLRSVFQIVYSFHVFCSNSSFIYHILCMLHVPYIWPFFGFFHLASGSPPSLLFSPLPGVKHGRDVMLTAHPI